MTLWAQYQHRLSEPNTAAWVTLIVFRAWRRQVQDAGPAGRVCGEDCPLGCRHLPAVSSLAFVLSAHNLRSLSLFIARTAGLSGPGPTLMISSNFHHFLEVLVSKYTHTGG